SYVPDTLPVSLDYVYCTLRHAGPGSVTLEAFFLESADDAAIAVRDLDLPAGSIRGRRLRSGDTLAVGFLRDLLTRRLRQVPHLPDPFVFRVVCATRDGQRCASDAHSLALDYPRTPMQDVELSLYGAFFSRRTTLFHQEMERIRSAYGSLRDYADLHLSLGQHKIADSEGRAVWRLREWMPAASALWLTTDRLNFQLDDRYAFERIDPAGLWELTLPAEELPHGAYIELRLRSMRTGEAMTSRIPALAVRVEQNPDLLEQWCARIWDPPEPYVFRHDSKRCPLVFPRIYEAHVGIAQPYLGRTAASVGSYADFTRAILPRIAQNGYTAVQLMGILEHPLYKSFGYQVSGYFAPSSRFGTPEAFKELVDTAHGLGLAVILDITHSHAAPNTEQGIARYDGSPYFFAGKRNQWGTSSFDYRNEMTRRFLLSNCRYWMDVFHVDGFRFDAVGNMIYVDHGFGDDFSHVDRCFHTGDGSSRIDEAGVLYLTLANTLVHELAGHSVTLAEEFSGMPGMTSDPEQGGLGFDYRFAMGIPDFWGKFIKEEQSVGAMWHEMINRRFYERTVSYVACHDQCINGKDAMIWRLIGDEMYTMMSCFSSTWKTSRGIALYKLMRLVTLSTAGHGWLNFMGDEFGHPEWIDAGAYGHRQWHLPESSHVKYAGLAAFDRDILAGIAQEHAAAFPCAPLLRHLHEADRTLAFERGPLLLVFNFHELSAQPRLDLWVTPGKYVEKLSTDAMRYAGHGNLEVGQPPLEHFSESGHGPGWETTQRVRLYLPPLTALVLRREP
ncbi:MAG: alpha amylase C-terminal domain-containing protein, partial [Deltaproteobacteria bacterium]|nr:alpha amylase C-terminal domain-containing protein [Deltaproteobacteria bacterium]